MPSLTGIRRLNARAETYTLTTLYDVRHDIDSHAAGAALSKRGDGTRFLREFRAKNPVRFIFGFHFLKLYYVFSGPLVTLVARSNRLMSIARILFDPTVKVLRKILR